MNKYLKSFRWFLPIIGLIVCVSPQAQEKTKALTAARVIDGYSKTALLDTAIIVEADKIIEIVKRTDIQRALLLSIWVMLP